MVVATPVPTIDNFAYGEVVPIPTLPVSIILIASPLVENASMSVFGVHIPTLLSVNLIDGKAAVPLLVAFK